MEDYEERGDSLSVRVVAEQVGLDSFWINDILSGIKKEADKKNLHIENFQLNVLPADDSPVVLVVGYTKEWIERTCAQVISCRARPLLVNAPKGYINAAVAGSISFDYRGAMDRLLAYLAACGKRRIAFIGCRGNRLSFDCKTDAFKQASPAKCFEKADVLSCDEVSKVTDVFMRRLVKYDAVVCSRDTEAIELSARLLKYGVRIPEDVFVSTFGDSNMAQNFAPALTALATDFEELGREAVKLSRYLSHAGQEICVNTVVSCPLSVRESTADIKLKSEAKALPKALLSYHNDNEYASFLQAEQLMRMWDGLDRKIVAALLEGRNTASVAEKLFISQSSVKYRIKKMLETAKLKGRSELISLVARYDLL